MQQPFLSQLQDLSVVVPGLKERLFDWVVDLRPRQFDQLCSEIVGLHRFQKKYCDVLVTDAPRLAQPFVNLLTRVEYQVEITEEGYDRTGFYRWLEHVDNYVLQQLIMEIDALYEQAVEHMDCYVVDERLYAQSHSSNCWKMQLETAGHLSMIMQELRRWKTAGLYPAVEMQTH